MDFTKIKNNISLKFCAKEINTHTPVQEMLTFTSGFRSRTVLNTIYMTQTKFTPCSKFSVNKGGNLFLHIMNRWMSVME